MSHRDFSDPAAPDASALRSAAERAALAVRSVGVGTWALDVRTGKALWDEQMWALRGLAVGGEVLTEAERLACVHPDDRAPTQAMLFDALSTSKPLDHEFRVVWPDGRVRWLASRSIEWRDGEGRVQRIGVNWDVTDKHTSQAARQEREIAQRESESKSKFLARMSHELRTPLNAVLGFAQLMLGGETGHDEAAALRRERLLHIHAAGEQLLALIEGMLEPSGAEADSGRWATTGAETPSAAAPAAGAGLPAARPTAVPYRVLYIEDNPVNALLVAELIARRSDMTLRVAVDGGSGVAQATALQPDLILLDMQLPDFDGFEVLRQLRAQPATAGIPCIALSANAMPEDIQRALQAGMADYWTKPLDFRVFMESLDALFKARAGS